MQCIQARILWTAGFLFIAMSVHAMHLQTPAAYWSVSVGVYVMYLMTQTFVRMYLYWRDRKMIPAVVARSADPFYQVVSEGYDRRGIHEIRIR